MKKNKIRNIQKYIYNYISYNCENCFSQNHYNLALLLKLYSNKNFLYTPRVTSLGSWYKFF